MQFFLVFLLLLFSTYAVILLMMVLQRRRGRGRRAPDEPDEADRPVSNGPIIEVINVAKAFDFPVLRGVTFSVARGETLGCLLYTSPSPRD